MKQRTIPELWIQLQTAIITIHGINININGIFKGEPKINHALINIVPVTNPVSISSFLSEKNLEKNRIINGPHIITRPWSMIILPVSDSEKYIESRNNGRRKNKNPTYIN